MLRIIGNGELRVTSSIGVRVFPEDIDDPTKLLSYADAAVYRAEASGRRNVQFYASRMHAVLQARLKLKNDLHLALSSNELELHYRARIHFAWETVVGHHALLHWKDSENGLIEPSTFIPTVEDSGLIIPIGEWVIRDAYQQTKRWHATQFEVLSMAVNLSARQFFDSILPGRFNKRCLLLICVQSNLN